LGRDGAGARRRPWHDRADAQEFRRDCDADLAGLNVGGHDRERRYDLFPLHPSFLNLSAAYRSFSD
jgi:hypothetical protein